MAHTQDATQTHQQQPLAQLETLHVQMDALKKELAHTQRLALLGTMTGIIAHEFNNLLTPVLSYAELAQSSPDNPELVSKALSRAIEGVSKVAKIARSVLALSRDDAAAGGRDDRVALIKSALDDALLCLARDLSADRIDLQVSIPEGASVAMRPLALQQVLLNLILNARKAMLSGGGVLRVSVTRPGREEVLTAFARQGSTCNGPDSEWTLIEVSDTGPGVPADVVESLRHRKGAPGGGLGLLICRRLVDEAAGIMSIERPSQTTNISLFLPTHTVS